MINIIVAFCRNKGIGIKNTLPWNLPNDLKRFKALTNNNTIIMGKNTWYSLPVRPLPNRENIVVSNTMDKDKTFSQFIIKNSLKDAIKYSKELGNKNIWIIGGSSIYKEALNSNYVNNIYATEIEGHYYCDVFFPEIPDNFKLLDASNWYTHKFTEYRYIHYKNENPENI